MVARDESKLCGAKTHTGAGCRHYAGFRTTHKGFGRCYKHGGDNPAGKKAAAKEMVAAVVQAVDARRPAFYGEAQATNSRDALRAELARSSSIVLHLEQMLGGAIGGLDPEARNAALSPAQLETLKALHSERAHLVRVSELVTRLDLDGLDEVANQRLSDRIVLSIQGFIAELGHQLEEPGVRAAARHFLDACIALTDAELNEYAGVRGNDILPSSHGRGMGT